MNILQISAFWIKLMKKIFSQLFKKASQFENTVKHQEIWLKSLPGSKQNDRNDDEPKMAFSYLKSWFIKLRKAILPFYLPESAVS